MMKKWFGTVLVAACTLGFSAMAQAAPYKWTFTGVTFDDGSTASGSFVADVDTQEITQINISVTAGSAGGPITFRELCNEAPCQSSGIFVSRQPGSDMTGMSVMFLSLGAALPTNGGTVPVLASISTCQSLNCQTGSVRNGTGGTLMGAPYVAPAPSTATPVPTLNDWGILLLSALTIGAAGFFTRKRIPN
ncbi:IPTL-CTERM sorting domain-containing protein [Diaphorobacter sp. HDW4A]|uniref:IPTL-CTERM sorting domain-containing protein n=1 Tax=Diaphorobacter sp. HDW4A TaxID=2714924 RepID=UPI001407AF77|nr:IPTL-CTERM sorting domain-containing protein [Diaphorobacter sp. HDW4A]QIL80948.1 IPTL-CTERM sorting domain-containing protein [Diaphorobacter sp. HDW4A]